MLMEPKRVQRKRTKGWRMPEGAVYVGRPTSWGSPYIVCRGVVGITRRHRVPRPVVGWCVSTLSGATLLFRQREEALRASVWHFERALRGGQLAVTVEDVRRELRGKDLACWCRASDPCHADVLLRVANERG
jgi:hypothetical protein